MSSEEATLFVTSGVILHSGRIIRPRAGRRLRVIEENDPSREAFKPELFDKGIPAPRPT